LNAIISDAKPLSMTAALPAGPARSETAKESSLADKLRELGWDLIERGQETRLGPQIETHDWRGREKLKPDFGNSYGFHQRDVFDVCLPRPAK
jgi:hypothetical protein